MVKLVRTQQIGEPFVFCLILLRFRVVTTLFNVGFHKVFFELCHVKDHLLLIVEELIVLKFQVLSLPDPFQQYFAPLFKLRQLQSILSYLLNSLVDFTSLSLLEALSLPDNSSVRSSCS